MGSKRNTVEEWETDKEGKTAYEVYITKPANAVVTRTQKHK